MAKLIQKRQFWGWASIFSVLLAQLAHPLEICLNSAPAALVATTYLPIYLYQVSYKYPTSRLATVLRYCYIYNIEAQQSPPIHVKKV